MSYIFKNCGAFFIKRTGLRFPKIYRAYLAEYIDYILQSGKNVEFFIEGTRSRTGKVVPPKFGILKYIFESFRGGSIRNAILVPLTINYENVIEVNQLLNEWFGRSKKKESLAQLVSAMGVLRQEFGDIFVKVGKPISLAAFAAKTEGVEFDKQLAILADDVAQQLQRNTLVMNTCLISALFLLNQSDLSFVKLFRQMEVLQEAVSALGGKLNKNCEDELILQSCRYFDFLEVDRGRQIVVYKQKGNTFNVFKMLYYRNFAFHFFIKDALIASVLKSGAGGSEGVTAGKQANPVETQGTTVGAEIPVASPQSVPPKKDTSTNAPSPAMKVIDLERQVAALADILHEESFKIGFEDTSFLDYLRHNCLGIYDVTGGPSSETVSS